MTRIRHGHSLIELLAIISAMTVLMAVIAVTLTSLLRLEHASGEQLAWQSTWHRLSIDLRDDARAATAASLKDDDKGAARLSLTLPSGATIEYHAAPAHVERRELRDGQPVATETYRLPEVYAAKLSLTGEPPEQQATIELSRSAAGSAGPNAQTTLPLKISVVVGRDHRLSQLVAAEDEP